MDGPCARNSIKCRLPNLIPLLRAMMCREAHSEGITRENIENALKILPVVSNYLE